MKYFKNLSRHQNNNNLMYLSLILLIFFIIELFDLRSSINSSSFILNKILLIALALSNILISKTPAEWIIKRFGVNLYISLKLILIISFLIIIVINLLFFFRVFL